ncbi:MAG: branched-chain amino acid aminotransferase [Candidatus Metalachnospira sp.]|nr:branched-chain amino acid aminotransferase [Candidatus Metalachnospira sp.]
MKIKFEERKLLKQKPDMEDLGFGRVFSDYMILVDYNKEQGWHDARIVPYGPLNYDPGAMIFHYGQSTFEGLKAYYIDENTIHLFRPEKNFERMNNSNDRLCIPKVDPEEFTNYIIEALKIEKDWIPKENGKSLYIRPMIVATDECLGVHASKTYQFVCMFCPVASYYKSGIEPVKIYVEHEFKRAVKGGTGFAKTAANYAQSLKSQEEAEEAGYAQVLWLDAIERKYIEEVGSMNIMFVIDGTVVTPELNGSILPGITRTSALELLRDKGYKVEERKISIEELIQAAEQGRLDEVFGTGTAAVISPVGEILYEGKNYIINGGKIGPIAQEIYDTITDTQYGRIEDKYNWIRKIKI